MSVPRLGLGSASEVEASYTLEGGYGTEALPDGTGAWLAHRAQADVPGSGPGGSLKARGGHRKMKGWRMWGEAFGIILLRFCGLKMSRDQLGHLVTLNPWGKARTFPVAQTVFGFTQFTPLPSSTKKT